MIMRFKRNQVNCMIISAKAHHEKTFTNPKALFLFLFLSALPVRHWSRALYGYLKSRSKIRTSISKLVKLDGSLTKNVSEVVKELNGF